jgi:hypothetical protein
LGKAVTADEKQLLPVIRKDVGAILHPANLTQPSLF